jgi:hypothetical protein
MLEYFEEPGAGTQLWRDKVIASHLTAAEMHDTLAELEAQLPKSHALGYHFTDLDSVKLISSSIGIRASTDGQLGVYSVLPLDSVLSESAVSERVHPYFLLCVPQAVVYLSAWRRLWRWDGPSTRVRVSQRRSELLSG